MCLLGSYKLIRLLVITFLPLLFITKKKQNFINKKFRHTHTHTTNGNKKKNYHKNGFLYEL